MGQSYSTPLSVMTDHFSDFKSKAQNLSMLVKKSKLRTLCSSEWLTFQVGWPPEGTFGLPVICAVKDRIMAPDPRGHPDQAPYILVWENLVEDPPVWLKPFIHNPPSASVPQVLVMETSKEENREARESRKKPILQESSLYPSLIDLDTEISPPPYIPPPLLPQVPQVSSGEQRGNSEPSAPQQDGGPAQGTRGRTRGGRDSSDYRSQRPLRLLLEHFLSGSGQQILTGNGTTNTGLSLLATYVTGKLKTPLFLKSPKALLIF